MNTVVRCWCVFFLAETRSRSRFVRNMASQEKCGLTEEILELVFDSDAENDVCDDDNVLLDDAKY